jgi:UDP-glucose 4-epimerase
MKAFVTGGAGFIGSHLAEALCRRGAQVVVLDDLSLGNLSNLDWKRNGDALEFVRGDVTNEKLARQLMAGCEWVFHEAALPSVPFSVAQPVQSNAHNLDAALQLLVLAKDAGVKRFVFASSSAIYGDTDVATKHEQLPPDPLSPYALQKYAAEKYGQLFYKLHGLTTVSLRYFNVFGPRQAFDSPYSGVIAKFCTNSLQGKAPTIYGDGKQTRDFTYIENVVQANLLAVKAPARKVAGKVFNIATGRSVSLLDLVAELNYLTGQSLTPQFKPARAGDVRFSTADITAARKNLGYRQKITLREGLKKTLDFYRSSDV